MQGCRTQVMFLDGKSAKHSHTAHTQWVSPAHGACKFCRCERSYSVSFRQLPPRLVRVLLVKYYALFSGRWIPELPHCRPILLHFLLQIHSRHVPVARWLGESLRHIEPTQAISESFATTYNHCLAKTETSETSR